MLWSLSLWFWWVGELKKMNAKANQIRSMCISIPMAFPWDPKDRILERGINIRKNYKRAVGYSGVFWTGTGLWTWCLYYACSARVDHSFLHYTFICTPNASLYDPQKDQAGGRRKHLEINRYLKSNKDSQVKKSYLYPCTHTELYNL